MKQLVFNRDISLSVLAVLLLACANDRPIAKAPPAELRKPANSEPSQRPAGVEAMFELAGPKCTELAKHLLSLTEEADEKVGTDWEEGVKVQLSVCMAADYSSEETQCMKTASSMDEFEGCTTSRREAARGAERESRNPQSIQWEDNIDSGFVLASAQSKPVVLHFVADWCIPCVQFEKQVLGDATVARELKDRFVTVRLDVTNSTPSDEKLQNRFKAKTLPALLVLSATGQEITRIQSGRMPSVDEFLAQLSAIK